MNTERKEGAPGVQELCDRHGLKNFDAGFATGLAYACTVASGGMKGKAARLLASAVTHLAEAHERQGKDLNPLLRVHRCALDIIETN